jgi:hypothetical protein
MRLCRHHGGSTPRPPIGMEPSSLVMSGSLPTRKLDCRRDNFPFASDSPAMSAEPDVHGDAYRVGIANLCSGPQLPPWSTHSFGFSTEVAQASERVRPPWRKSRCASRYTTGRMLQPLRRSKENRSETHPPDKDATLTNGVLSF